MDRLYSNNAQLKARAEQLEEENKNLEQGLKEVMEAMKKYGVRATEDGEEMEKGQREVSDIQFPALERMLAVSVVYIDCISCTFLATSDFMTV